CLVTQAGTVGPLSLPQTQSHAPHRPDWPYTSHPGPNVHGLYRTRSDPPRPPTCDHDPIQCSTSHSLFPAHRTPVSDAAAPESSNCPQQNIALVPMLDTAH